MPLEEYKKKRTFSKTPEPSGKVPKNKQQQLRFVVQEHHASHLHYDFRLELDGVLKSWAVPKGPSMDPEVKRLAMMVEDHPIDYITFQGEIPKGNYGAGQVKIWDNGVYRSSETLDDGESRKKLKSGLFKGDLKFVLLGNKLKGSFGLIKIKKDDPDDNSWLLIKKRDEFSLKDKGKKENKPEKSPMPHEIKPMLAKLVDEPFDQKGWIFEIKWDGYRAVSEIQDGNVSLYSRRGNSFNKDYPAIVEALKKSVKKNAIFDGEIVALKNGRPDFHSLQNLEESNAPLQYVIFDLLYWDGEDLQKKPLAERKEFLKKIFPNNQRLLYCDHVEENGKQFFELMKKQGFEGMIAKDASSPYLQNNRGNYWLKIKHHNVQEAIIIGYTEPRGSRKGLGALVLGAFDNGKLKYIGHSGGGFTSKELKEVCLMLSKDAVDTSPVDEKVSVNSPITWVKPKYVCQIEFTEWTPDGHMRHPIYAGLREDKKPEEVKIERPEAKVKNNESEKQSFTNLDKVFWPKEGYTKGDVIEYYEKMAATILPYLKDRPENLLRHPNGIEGQSFFQKDITNKIPSFAETVKIWSESNEKDIHYLLCQNKETLLYLANLGCIELNPWNSRIKSLDKPDYMIIDLDPGDNTFDELVKMANVAHEVLLDACEEHYCKTSGKRGIHIMVPLGAQYDYDMIRQFSELLVRIIHSRIPEITSLDRSPSKRKKKIYLDYLQNRRGQTIAAPYSLRPWPGATVSTPLEWKEVKKGLDPKDFNIKTIWKRLEKKGDLWKPLLTNKIDLEESIRCLQKMKLV